MNIPEIKNFIKSRVGGNSIYLGLFIVILIASNIASFKIGQNSVISPIAKENTEPQQDISYSLKDPDLKPGSLAAVIYANSNNEPNREEDMGQIDPSIANIPPRYVASKNGRVYYFTWCAGAKRILEENRQYFQTASDARAAGLSPSTACPDLD